MASKLPKALNEIMMCCERLKECEICGTDGCPFWGAKCLEETDFATIAYETSSESWQEFINAAEDAEEPAETQEEWEAEQGNLRRCDPDDF